MQEEKEVSEKTGANEKKVLSIVCLLVSLSLFFLPWSGDYQTSIQDSYEWSFNVDYTADEISAVAGSVEDGASPYELIRYSLCYADVLLSYHEGGLAGLYRSQSADEYRICAVWIILTMAAHVITVALRLLNARDVGAACPVMILMILGLFIFLRAEGEIDNLSAWGFVSLLVSIFSCVLWALYKRN